MADVTRLCTTVDLPDRAGDSRSTMSFDARLEALLDDGRRVVLLDDRGWSASTARGHDVWALMTEAEIESTARTVVGPDEPYDGRSQHDMVSSHWEHLSAVLRRHGVDAEAAALQQLPHDVVLTDRVRAQLA